MRISTIVSWFTTSEIRLGVYYGNRGHVALEIYDKDDGQSPDDCRVFIHSKDEKKLIAAVEAFNKVWEETK